MQKGKTTKILIDKKTKKERKKYKRQKEKKKKYIKVKKDRGPEGSPCPLEELEQGGHQLITSPFYYYSIIPNQRTKIKPA